MVSILITTYNSASHLKACLESVLRQDLSDREIIVIDNASSDGTRAVLREFETRARVIYNDTNRGFSGGQNQAIMHARGDWMLSLNPDVLLSPGFLTKLVEAGESDARIGTVCGKLLHWGTGVNLPTSSIQLGSIFCVISAIWIGATVKWTAANMKFPSMSLARREPRLFIGGRWSRILRRAESSLTRIFLPIAKMPTWPGAHN